MFISYYLCVTLSYSVVFVTECVYIGAQDDRLVHVLVFVYLHYFIRTTSLQVRRHDAKLDWPEIIRH